MKELRRQIRQWAKENKRSDISCLRKIDFWVKNGICEPIFDKLVERLQESIKFGKRIVLEKLIIDYGEEIGRQKWNHYLYKQALTNTKEYKMKVHGMSSQEVDEYNRSRAVTLDNMVKKYGREEGTKRYNEYCSRQQYAGCQLEYFIEKYGDELGTKKYNEVCHSKAHTIDNYIKRYGHEEGIKRLEQFHQHISSSNTAISSKQISFIDRVETLLTDDEKQHGHREYTVYCHHNKRVFKYDYVNTKLKFCIEYNGDYWHANPIKYAPSDIVHHNYTAEQLWEADVTKMKAMFDNRDISHYNVVWESAEWSDDEILRILNEYRAKQ